MYIVIEGIDFSGKSTIGKYICEQLNGRFVAEPYIETEAARELKARLVSNTMSIEEEIEGYASSRVLAFQDVIHDLISTGQHVVSDRNVLSSMVYQTNEQYPMEQVLDINRKLLSASQFDIQPDLVFFMDITHEEFLERLSKAQENNRELNNKDFMFKDKVLFEHYRDKYLKALHVFSKDTQTRVYRVTTEDDVNELVMGIVGGLLKEQNK